MYGLGFTTPRIMLGQNYCHVSWCLESWHRRRQTARAPRIFAAAPWQTSNNTTWVDEAVCAWHRMRKKIHPSSASSLPRASPSEKVCLNLQAVQSKLWSTRFHPGSHLCGSMAYPIRELRFPMVIPMDIPYIHGLSHWLSMAYPNDYPTYHWRNPWGSPRSLRPFDPMSWGPQRAHRLESLRPKESSAPHRGKPETALSRNDCNVVNPIIQPLTSMWLPNNS